LKLRQMISPYVSTSVIVFAPSDFSGVAFNSSFDFDLTKKAAKRPKIKTAGMTDGPTNRNKKKKSASNLLTTIVDKGSPIGVKTAPKPMEKQAKMTKRISDLRSIGNTLTT